MPLFATKTAVVLPRTASLAAIQWDTGAVFVRRHLQNAYRSVKLEQNQAVLTSTHNVCLNEK